MKYRFFSLLLVVNFFFVEISASAQLNTENDSILKLFSHIENKRDRLDSLQRFIGKNHRIIKSDPIPLIEHLMNEAKRVEYDIIYSDFLSLKALFVTELYQDYKLAEQMFKRELELKEKYGADSSRLSVAYYNVGTAIMQQGRFEEGIPNITMALKIADDINDAKRAVYAYSALALSYTNLGQDSLAMYYSQQSYETALKEKMYREAINALQNQVFMFIALEQHEQAEKVVDKIDAIIPNIPDEDLRMRTIFTKGSLNLRLKKYDEGLQQLRTVEEYYQENNMQNELASVKFNRAKIYSDIGNYQQAVAEFKEVLEIYKNLGVMHQVMRVFYELTYNYQLLEDFDNAFYHLDKYFILRDSLMNSDTQKKIAEVMQQYEADKKQGKIDSMEQKDLLQVAEIEKQKNIRNFSLVVAGLIFLLALLLVRNYRLKIKTQKRLTAQKEEIDHQSLMLEATEEERKRIAKELHDGIGGTLAGVKLKLLSFAEDKKEANQHLVVGRQAKKLAEQVGDACDELRTISHNLTPPKLFNASFTEVIKNFMQTAYENTNMEFGFNYSQEEEINSLSEEKKTHLYRIIQELVNNAIKHSGAVFADVDLNVRDGNLNFIYTDDGFGFEEKMKDIKSGIGLGGIQTRVKLMKGIFNIVSKAGMGTAIDIQIPIKNEKHQYINS